eukprot:TRINITY_DN9765_c1_g4_i1.p1 TRINITY_DN9765_c1_g4~~TRINITY_DN9765_c1_g4_i1.p1  ORF type:complete len:438 (+),score=59.40 TRINITY_DN9765_c1_g4_i1:45-1316(+)
MQAATDALGKTFALPGDIALTPIMTSDSDCNATHPEADTEFISSDNLIGVMIEIVAASICIIGMNAMKASRENWALQREKEMRETEDARQPWADGGQAESDQAPRSLWQRMTDTNICYMPWLASLIIYAIGEGMQVFALSWGDASVIQSVSMLALVLNAYIARFYFKEQLPRSAIAATGVVILGAGMASMGGITPPCLDLGVFKNHMRRELSIVAFCALGVIIGCMLLLLGGFGHTQFVRGHDSMLHSVLASALGSISFFGGNIFSKLGRATLREGTGFGSFLLSGAIFLTIAVCELLVLNRGLSHCDSSVFIPTYYVLITLFLLVTNTAFFSKEAEDQYRDRIYKLPLFASGIVLILIGVSILGHIEGKRAEERGDQADAVADDDDDTTEQSQSAAKPPAVASPVMGTGTYAALSQEAEETP